MIIEKKEIIRFSENELRCVEMATMFMETLVKNATDPNLVEDAKRAYNSLVQMYNYI